MSSFHRLSHRLRLGSLCVASLGLSAFQPAFHEAQTRMALSRVPTRLQQLLRTHLPDVLRSVRGMPMGKLPTVEDIEAQFLKVLLMSQERRPFELIAREMGLLAYQVQLLSDPSCLQGSTPLRDHFAAFADQMLPTLVLTDAPYWALAGAPEPGPRLRETARKKTERLALLDTHFDERSGKRLVVWDRLSVPYALLQLSYNQGVHDTANIWIMLYRVTGASWINT